MASAPDTAPSATRLAVIGTAGHIDHGKTALVRRLTGVDTDRLPEEKKRGISIDLGFAPLVTPAGVHCGIVDVPGHERFVKNMLSGVGGIDVVLLVIAADEGVMPQTREHLAIVELLGIPRGIVALTKSDRVEREWLDLVTRDVRAALASTSFAQAPIVEFSAVTGQGQAELLAALDRELAQLANRPGDEPVRLPVDRAFIVEGFGTVVTGTLWRGAVRVGDALELQPSGRAVRVRRVQVHGHTVEQAQAGQRTALALHGVDRGDVERGEWLIAPGSLVPSRTLDVRFELLADVPQDWPAVSRVRFHVGASEIIGRLVLLEGQALKPGGSALAQLRLERPAVAARGDRFVIRSYSPSRTIGGGTVIEPVARRRRRSAQGLDQLVVHERGSIEARLLEKLGAGAFAAARVERQQTKLVPEPVERDRTKLAPGPIGRTTAGSQRSDLAKPVAGRADSVKPVATAVLAQAVSEPEARVLEALKAMAASREVIEPSAGRWILPERWAAARAAIEGEVRDHATRFPARYGVLKGDLKSGLKAAMEAMLFDAAYDALVREQVLEQRGDRVRPADSPWSAPPEMLAALERGEARLEATGLSVPDAAAWQKELGVDAAEIVALGAFLGRLVRVTQDLTYTSRQLETLRAKLAAHFASKPSLTVAEFKDLAAVSRKHAVPLLEHADRVSWTVRVGDERRGGARLNTGPHAPTSLAAEHD